jgi:Ni,Fe-hydrogenase III large subunit
MLMSYEKKVESLLEKLRAVGPMHKGTVNERYQRCNKPTCWCADRSKQGHGPVYVLTWKENQVTRAKTLRADEILEARQLIENQRAFERLVKELSELKTHSFEQEKKTSKSSSPKKPNAR